MSEFTVHHAAGSLYEAKFRAHGVKFEYVEEFRIREATSDRTIQVRDLGSLAPSKRVDRYLEQMNAGANFPPIVVRAGDFALIDGNTRLAAAAKLGRDVLPAYIVTTDTPRQARKLAGSLNQNGAADLADDEVRRVAMDAKASGESDTWIAREYGVQYSKVRRWIAVDEGAKHAESVGVVDLYGGLTQNQQVTASSVKRDEPFKELVTAIATHQVPNKDLKDLVKAVEAAPSDIAAVEAIKEAALGWPERDPADNSRRHSKPSQALSAKMPLGRLLKQPAEEWIDLSCRDELLPRWEELRELADQVIAGYQHG